MENALVETNSIESINKNNMIKILAIAFMTLDHIGAILFPKIIAFRLIGRLAFPIFAYCLADGFIHTRSVTKYGLRLFVFALISQISYYMAFGQGTNVYFTLLIGLICMHYLKKKRKRYYILSLFLLSWLMQTDYNIYGLIVILIFRYCKDNKKLVYILFSIATIGYAFITTSYIQMFSIFALPIIYMEYNRPVKINKYLFYIYYPIHLTLLVTIKLMINYFMR